MEVAGNTCCPWSSLNQSKKKGIFDLATYPMWPGIERGKGGGWRVDCGARPLRRAASGAFESDLGLGIWDLGIWGLGSGGLAVLLGVGRDSGFRGPGPRPPGP